MEHSIWQFFVDHRPGWVVDIAKLLGVVGDETVLLPLTLLVAVWALYRGRRTLATLAPFTVMVGSFVAVGALKTLVNRDRPPVVDRLVEVSTRSMPSGHATYAAALAALVFLLVPAGPRQRLFRIAAVVLAVSAGVSRMVLGVHWAGDVAAGWLLGTGVSFGVVHPLRRRLQSVA